MMKDDILKIKPGPEMNALIAVEIFKYIPVYRTWYPNTHDGEGLFNCSVDQADAWCFEYPGGVKMPDGKEYCATPRSQFRPSTDIATAFVILDKLPKGWTVEIFKNKAGAWGCQVLNDHGHLASWYAPTASAAICYAVLLATMETL